MKRSKYLICVDVAADHNKFYQVTENEDRSLDVVYGRVGATANAHHYAPYERRFEELIEAKERKGYVEKTALHQARTKEQEERPIDDAEIAAFVSDIIRDARQFVQENYTISYEAITPKMLAQAQETLNRAAWFLESMGEPLPSMESDCQEAQLLVDEFNSFLTELFTDVPRRMARVRDCCAKTPSDCSTILTREQEMLDNLNGQVTTLREANDTVKKNILEKNGLTVTQPTYDEEDYLIEKLAKKNWEKISNEDRYLRSLKITNAQTEQRFSDYCKEHGYRKHHGTHFYFHGTRFENLWSILRAGLVLNPDAHTTGKGFGKGLYFAEHSQKSIGYTSMQGARWNHRGDASSGWLLVYEVATGISLRIRDTADQIRYGTKKTFTREDLKAIDGGKYDSVYAVGKDQNGRGVFKNSEIMVYDERQCTIRYAVEIDSQSHPFSLSYDERLALRFEEGATPITTTDGITAQIDVTKLTKATKELLESKLLSEPVDTLYLTYKPLRNQIEVTKANGVSLWKSTVTSADKAWVMRQWKRCYAANDKEFQRLVSKSAKEKKKELAER